MNRIEKRFKKLSDESRAGLVTFLTAGDPTLALSERIINRLPESGVDFIELGMPFSDPMADGPTIQLANQRALANGMSLKKTLDLVLRFREKDSDTPIILMGYYNPIYQMGVATFLEKAAKVGVDGLIIVDLPFEEDEELCVPAKASGIDWIRLITPTSDDIRLTTITQRTSGFLYYVSVAGITGTTSASQQSLSEATARIRAHSSLPIAVGFGIKNRSDVAQTAKFADAVVVGSAIINLIDDGLKQKLSDADIESSVLSYVKELANGLTD